MSTITFKRCEACGGINTLDDIYKCSNCGAITSPDKAIHIKAIGNDDQHVCRRDNFPVPGSVGTYIAARFATSYGDFDVGFGTSIDDFDDREEPGSGPRIKGLDLN